MKRDEIAMNAAAKVMDQLSGVNGLPGGYVQLRARIQCIIAELLPDAHAEDAEDAEDAYKHVCELYHAQEKRLFKLAQRLKGPSFDKYAHSPSQAIDVLEAAIFGEKPVIGTIDYAACEALYLGNIIPEADK